MILFKFYKRIIFGFVALCVMLTLCTAAKAAGRIGIYDVHVYEGDMTAPKQYTMADVKRLEQLQQKYTEILMKIFSERTDFEAVKLVTEYEKTMQQVQKAQQKISPLRQKIMTVKSYQKPKRMILQELIMTKTIMLSLLSQQKQAKKV